MLPSRELLSEILRMEIVSLRIAGNFIMFNVYTPLGRDERGINIYELMHLMKEWLRTKQIMITVYHHLDTVEVSFTNKDGDIFWSPPMPILTEFEAVTKECEWILNEK